MYVVNLDVYLSCLELNSKKSYTLLFQWPLVTVFCFLFFLTARCCILRRLRGLNQLPLRAADGSQLTDGAICSICQQQFSFCFNFFFTKRYCFVYCQHSYYSLLCCPSLLQRKKRRTRSSHKALHSFSKVNAGEEPSGGKETTNQGEQRTLLEWLTFF